MLSGTPATHRDEPERPAHSGGTHSCRTDAGPAVIAGHLQEDLLARVHVPGEDTLGVRLELVVLHRNPNPVSTSGSRSSRRA